MLPISGQCANFEHFKGLIRMMEEDNAPADTWSYLRDAINSAHVFYLITALQHSELKAMLPTP